MYLSDIRKLIIDKLNPLYGHNEAEAIAFAYVREKFDDTQFEGSLLKWDESTSVITPASFEVDLDQLSLGRPLQYVLGVQWFCGLPLHVNEAVLIPRPETEELVHEIIKAHKDLPLKILDIGTGSGCIPVALKMGLPNATILATDISAKALKVAASNALRHGAEISFLEDDILNTKISETEKFDLIVSNPPYIPEKDASELDINVKNHEPASALFVSDSNPLLFYSVISRFARKRLKPDGSVYFEINKDYGKPVSDLLIADGFLNVTVLKDMSNNDRFVIARAS